MSAASGPDDDDGDASQLFYIFSWTSLLRRVCCKKEEVKNIE